MLEAMVISPNHLHSILESFVCYIRSFLFSWAISNCRFVAWFTLSSFGERALTCRNLADLTPHREAGITSWWKLLRVPVSPDFTVVHTHPSSRRTGLRDSSRWLQDQCLISRNSDRTSKGLPITLSEACIWIIFPVRRGFTWSQIFKLSTLRQPQKMTLIWAKVWLLIFSW